MSDLKPNFSARPPALLRNGGAPGLSRFLLNANREALHLLGMPKEASGDPQGRKLRQLRLQTGIDPSVLATQACMSLSQLYELEDGGHSRFYSDSLRRQAGRRVARLLGADWDQMATDETAQVLHTNNVVPIQRPSPLLSTTTQPMTPEILEVIVRVTPERSASTITDNGPHSNDSEDDQAVSMGLSTPASETLVVGSSEARYALLPTESASTKKTSGWSIAFTLLLVIGTGATAGYAFAEYSPYRLYWPW